MSFQTRLDAISQQFAAAPDEIKTPIGAAKAKFCESFDRAGAIQIGQKLPHFRLPDAVGHEVSSTELLENGPLLLTFYRGGWCPYCSIALHEFQSKLDELRAKGVTLVAISPELPDNSLSTVEKNQLGYTVLSDLGNQYARRLGLVFSQPKSLRPIFEKLGYDLTARNGDDSFEVPIPATLLIGHDGIVRKTFINPDYTKRVPVSKALEWIEGLGETNN